METTMGHDTAVKPAPSVTDTSRKATDKAPVTRRSPVIFTIVGRQRVGKTTLLNAVAEITRRQGGNFEIWNTDLQNRSHSISNFHDAKGPAEADMAFQQRWLRDQIQSLMESGKDAILDIGGGWTALHELINSASLTRALEAMGVTLMVAFMVGQEKADLDYLEDLQTNRGFFPKKGAIILNQGLIPAGVRPDDVMDQICAHPAVIASMARDIQTYTLPALFCLKEVTDRNLPFMAFATGEQAEGHPTTSIFDRIEVERWMVRDLPHFLAKLGKTRLPHMPRGLPVPETEGF